MNRNRLPILLAVTFISTCTVLGSPDEAARAQVSQIVSKIQRADYEGDQVGMQKGHDELTPFLENKELASRVRYWRGFAQWRRAINGFNDSVDPKELEQDLKQAVDEFKEAIAKDPAFADAKIAIVSCLGYLAYMTREDRARAQELFKQAAPFLREAKETAPENPRLLWVLGPILWNTPAERGGGQDTAIANYEKGLEFARRNKANADRLEPSWGEPELLMNLAWSHLNKSTPNVDAAERNARAALEIIPYWHYVQDILLPQILAAKAKAK